MNLILTLQEYLDKKPIYKFEVPEYLESVLGMTEEEYFEAGMYATQRIINTFMQNYFSSRDWNIDDIDAKVQLQLKDILFQQFQYLHENQIFFEKTTDINYSTAGQQTFTFNPDVKENDNFPLISKTVERMIINTGLISLITSLKDNSVQVSEFANEFKDGYFVPEVNWNDKANNLMTFLGTNFTLESAINLLQATKVSNNNVDYLKSIRITSKATLDSFNDRITWSTLLSSNIFYSSKQDNDYAQIKDLKDLWTNSNNAIVENTSQINDLQAATIALDQNKLNISDAEKIYFLKANTDLKNVNVGNQVVPQYLIVNTDGTISLSATSGNTSYEKYDPTKAYSISETVWTEEVNSLAKFWISKQNDNQGNTPSTSANFWVETEQQIDLKDYITKNDVFQNFLSISGLNSMQASFSMNGFNIEDTGNLLEKTTINDGLVSTSNVWSASKTFQVVQSLIPEVKKIVKYDIGEVVFFNTEDEGRAVIANYNKEIDVDFEYLSDEEINLILGRDGQKVKDGIVNRNNIRNFYIDHNHLQNGMYSSTTGSGGVRGTLIRSDIDAGSAYTIRTQTDQEGIGDLNPIPFTPRSRQVWAIRIIKTWYIDGYQILTADDPITEAIFKSGERVSEVDYLGLINKEAIEVLDLQMREQVVPLITTNTSAIETNKEDSDTNFGLLDTYLKSNEDRITALENGTGSVSEWSSTTTYKVGEQVTYQNKFYASLVNDNLNNNPSTSSTQWFLIDFSVEPVEVLIGKDNLYGFDTDADRDAFLTKEELLLTDLEEIVLDYQKPMIKLFDKDQTANGTLTTKQSNNLGSNVNTFDEFMVLCKNIGTTEGLYRFTFKNTDGSYGQSTTTNNYLVARENGKTFKWVNVSGGGSSQAVWFYTDLAIISVWGRKK